jgi:gluconokinase
MVIVIMGVAGAGKTTIGELLAARLGWQFADADAYHSAANVEKMSHGIPLTDVDREPWLRALNAAIHGWLVNGENVVLACSALKRRYRDILREGHSDPRQLRFVYLKGSFDSIYQQIHARAGHYMPESLLQSQFQALEPPDSTEALTVEIDNPDNVVQAIVVVLGLNPAESRRHAVD